MTDPSPFAPSPFASPQGPVFAPSPRPPAAELPLAGWGRRIAASVIDFVFGFLAFFVFLVIALAVSPVEDEINGAASILFLVLGCLAWPLYEPLLTARRGRRNGQSLGKQMLRIRIVRTTGEKLSLGRALLRGLVGQGILPLVLASGIYTLIDAIVGFASDKRATVHDLMAGTLVLRADADPASVAAALEPPPMWSPQPAGQPQWPAPEPAPPRWSAPAQQQWQAPAQPQWPAPPAQPQWAAPPTQPQWAPPPVPARERSWARRHLGWLIAGGVALALLVIGAGVTVLVTQVDFDQFNAEVESDSFVDELRDEPGVVSVREVDPPAPGWEVQYDVNSGDATLYFDSDGLEVTWNYEIADDVADADRLEAAIESAARATDFELE